MEITTKPIVVVGAGLAGSLLSIYLARRGYEVHLYEKRPDMRRKDVGGGRSINLALSTRGINALSKVGLADEVLRQSIPMKGRLIHSREGHTSFQPYSVHKNEAIFSTSRNDLNITLLEKADSYTNVHLFFEQVCEGVDYAERRLRFRHMKTGEETVYEDTPVIGADGAGSAIRRSMFDQMHRFSYSQQYLEHGYKELTIPPTADGAFKLDPNALHIWPRQSFMMIALPNQDGTFTCTLFLAYEGEPSFSRLQTTEAVRAFFEAEFPDALSLMPTLYEDFFQNPTSSLATVKCFPWIYEDQSVLLGDACHAVVPFYGQGMNCSFEDCVVFDDCLYTQGGDWVKAIRTFQQQRKPNTDAIADMAEENFIEMRDLVSDPDYILRRKAELMMETRYPERFTSRYSMVTFSHIPYAEAQARSKTQQAILEKHLKGLHTVDAFDPVGALAELESVLGS